MMRNGAKARLRGGEVVLGTMVCETWSGEIAYALAAAGFDFFVIDTEHSAAGMESIQQIVRAGRSAGIAPLVRVGAIAYPLIARTLDMGALGLMVPHVETPQDAREIVRCAKFPPAGDRGFGLRSAVVDYAPVSVAEAMEWSNAETMVMAQVESRRSLDNVEDIAATPGIDVLLIGPTDLSISLGVPGQLLHPKMIDAYRRVADAAQRHGIAAGLHPDDQAVVQKGRVLGMRCLMYSTEIEILVGAARQAVHALRGEPGERSERR